MFTSTLCELIKNYKYCKNDTDQVPNGVEQEKINQPVIGAIKEAQEPIAGPSGLQQPVHQHDL